MPLPSSPPRMLAGSPARGSTFPEGFGFSRNQGIGISRQERLPETWSVARPKMARFLHICYRVVISPRVARDANCTEGTTCHRLIDLHPIDPRPIPKRHRPLV